MKTKSKLSQEVFDHIKTLIELKIPLPTICKIVKKSYFTVMYVNKADNLKEYFKLIRDSKKVTKKEEVKPVAEQAKPLKSSMDEHNSIVVLLRAIIHNQEKMIELLK